MKLAHEELLKLLEFNLKHGTFRQKEVARELLLRFLEKSLGILK